MLSRVEELKLISRCVLADDRNAFGQLVEAYQPQLRRFLLNLTLGDPYLTDDLAQETFIKAYLDLRQFRGLARFGTWLYRIAYNEFCSYKRRNHATVDIDAIIEPPDDNSAYDASDASHDVRVALAQLGEIERTVTTLFYIEDMPLKQIATVTGLNQNTVRSHLHRARAKMTKILKK